MSNITYCVVVNENMHDSDAWIETHEGEGLPTMVSGWERVYSCHDTLEEAKVALKEAREYVNGRSL